MKPARLLLSFDIEEFDLPQEFGREIAPGRKFAVSRGGTLRILDTVEAAGVRATFFVTGNFAEANPDLIRRMVDGGHEIASHGMDHSSFRTEDLAASKAVLERVSGQAVTGFRMARLAPVAKEDILAAGYAYESSLNPVWLPGRYCNLGKPLKPFTEACGLRQFPVSALPLVRFPLFWLSFKNLPLGLYEFLCGCAVRLTGYYNMYSHPWEYSEESRAEEWGIPGYITHHAGAENASRLAHLLAFLKKRGEFLTFREYSV